MVKTSAYPGWSVQGADSIYRASPNFMVVVPTSKHVTLTHHREALDYVALACGIAGLAIAATLGAGELRRRRSVDSATGVS
jgi:hypothetical protein